jgi:S-adenosylmethionine decarboxylase
MKPLGRHIVAELSQCNPEVLCSVEKVKEYIEEAAKRAHAQILEVALHKFSPQGVSGVVVIAESHLSIHTWPELGYAAVDIYTCGETTNPSKACEYLAEMLGAKQIAQTILERGVETPEGWFSHTSVFSSLTDTSQPMSLSKEEVELT